MNYDSETFEDGEILLDGNSYVNCYFRRVKFIFTGILPVHLTNNKLIDCSWAFVGPAMETVSFMSGLYNGFESGRELIDRTFENIRMAQLANSEQPQISFKPTVFIGHGHSTDYLRLTVFLQNQDFKVETFESGPRAGMTAKEVLETMAARASIAFLVHTAEDEQEDGKIRARPECCPRDRIVSRSTRVQTSHCHARTRMCGFQQSFWRAGDLVSKGPVAWVLQ